MTINTQSAKVIVAGDGATSVFNYNFVIPSQADADLYLTNTSTGVQQLVDPALWTLSGAGNPAGGTFTYPLSGSPISAAYTLTLVRDVPYTQETSLTNQSGYYPRAVEASLDRIVMQNQQLAAALQLCFRASPGDPATNAAPSREARANQMAAWDGDGNMIALPIPGGTGDQPGVYWCGDAAGTANAIELTAAPVLSAYGQGQMIMFVATSNNTTATTVDVGGVGVVDLLDAGGNALGPNTLIADTVVAAIGLIDGAFRLLPSSGSGAGGGMTFVDATSPGSPTLGLNYSATVTTVPAEFEAFLLRLDRDADTGAVLSINGGTNRSLRLGTGNPIVPSNILAGRVYPAVRIGSLIYVTGTYSQVWVSNTFDAVKASSWWINWRNDYTEAFHRARILFDLTNGITFSAGGSGASNDAVAVLRAQADGDVRVFNRLLVGTPGYVVYTEGSPPPIQWEDMGDFFNLVKGPQNELTQQAVLSNSTNPGMLGAGMQDQHMRVTQTTNSWTDCSPTKNNTHDNMLDLSTGTHTLWSGIDRIWRGTNDGHATGNAEYTSVVSDSVASTFTFAAGNPVTETYTIGSVVQFSGLTEAANNGVSFTITAFSGASNRTVHVTPAPVTDAVPDVTFTMTRVGARQIAVTGPAMVQIITGQSDVMATKLPAETTLASVAVPTYGIFGGGLGQSWPQRMFSYGAAAGAQRTFAVWKETDAGINTGVYFADGCVGASALLEGAATVPTNYWWNQHTNTPGPNALYFRDQMLRHMDIVGSPTLSTVTVMYGLNDMAPGVWAATGSNTPAIWTASQLALQAWIRAELGLPGLIFLMVVVPARRIGVFTQQGYNAMRQAQLDCIAADPTGTFRGPDAYSLIRTQDDDHHGYHEQDLWGSWWPSFATRALGTRPSEYLGPRVVDFTEVSSSEYVWEIDPGTGRSMAGRVSIPNGFALWNEPSDLFADPATAKVNVKRFVWGTNGANHTLTAVPEVSGSGYIPIFPYGSCPEFNGRSRTVMDAITLLPLLTPRIGDYVT